jgi:hypothetical protein
MVRFTVFLASKAEFLDGKLLPRIKQKLTLKAPNLCKDKKKQEK